MKDILQRWLPPLAWMGLIFVVSAQPSLPSAPGKWDFLLKKSMHALSYGILAWLYRRALFNPAPRAAFFYAASAGLALAYAVSDEYHQTFVPGRSGTLVDVTVDGLGASAAMLLDWWRARRRGCSPRLS